MNSAPIGSDILVLSEVSKIGKALAFSECDLYSEKGVLLMSGRHTKAFIPGSFDMDENTWTVGAGKL